MHYLLIYNVVDDYVTRRAEFRPSHFEHAQRAYEAGDLVLAGALTDPVDKALFVFRTAEAAKRFAEDDPYIRNGLAKSWEIRSWTTVIGDGAQPPKL
jgi:uncharacterized protein YciI